MATENLLDRFYTLVEDVNHEAEGNEELSLLVTSLLATAIALKALRQKRTDISRAWFLKCDEFLEFKKLRDSLGLDRS